MVVFLTSGSVTSTTGARFHSPCLLDSLQLVDPTRTLSPFFSAPSGSVTVSGSPAAAKRPVPCQRGTERSISTSRVSRRVPFTGSPG